MRWVAAIVACCLSLVAQACIIIPPPHPQPPQPQPLQVREQHIEFRIHHPRVAVHVRTVLHNPGRRPAEGIFIFPLPPGASVSSFQFRQGDRMIEGELLERDKALREYQRIVARLKDPALLEYIGQDLFRARLFPVPPGKDAVIELRYESVPARLGQLVRVWHNIRIGRQQGPEEGLLDIKGRIAASQPIKTVFSPTHEITVDRAGDKLVRFSVQLRQRPFDRDFVLYYSVAPDPVGLDALFYRRGREGWFLLTLAPPVDVPSRQVRKRIVVAIDTSGSMSGAKIEQAKQAVAQAIRALSPGDQFALIAFSDEVQAFSDRLVAAKPDVVERAIEFIDGLRAIGGTALCDAAETAVSIAAAAARREPVYVLLVTDGRPTVGERNIGRIAERVAKANKDYRARLFAVGIGYDVNSVLLDKLTADNGGLVEYIRPGEDIEVALASLLRQIGQPVLTDLHFEIRGVRARDILPRKLLDLFRGQQAVVVGKYGRPGTASITLVGSLLGKQRRWSWRVKFPRRALENGWLPRLWATRKIAYLLGQIREGGEDEELKREIVRLALEYGIVTPYTAYIVREQRKLAEAQARQRPGLEAALMPGGAVAGIPPRQLDMARAGIAGPGYGAAAVQAGAALSKAQRAAAPAAPAPTAARHAGGKTFYYDAADRIWVDAELTSGLRTVRIAPYSAAYWRLVRASKMIAAWLSVGECVAVRIGGYRLEVVPGGAGAIAPDVLEALVAAAEGG